MARIESAALGFSVHTGWASLVAVHGSIDAPDVVERRRIELLAGKEADARRFVYHLASDLDLPAAKKLVDRTTAEVRATTLAALSASLAELEERGFRAERGAILGGGAPPSGSLESILRSHAAIHSAEGQLYRGAIAAACHSLGVTTALIPARELAEAAADATGIATGTMAKHAANMKRLVGPPWAQDQQHAMLAAWSALAAGAAKRRRRR